MEMAAVAAAAATAAVAPAAEVEATAGVLEEVMAVEALSVGAMEEDSVVVLAPR